MKKELDILAEKGIVVTPVMDKPKPILFTLYIPEWISEDDVANIREQWNEVFNGKPPAPLFIVTNIMTLEPLLAQEE